ncbi:MAG: hypothetical protein AB7G47_20020 [Mycolicibacterium sp.]|uniref:hypothetical protein n=1 Tax=Mycolicibacterium sp. TaxID=2320850 RepID=UPI003D11FE6F
MTGPSRPGDDEPAPPSPGARPNPLATGGFSLTFPTGETVPVGEDNSDDTDDAAPAADGDRGVAEEPLPAEAAAETASPVEVESGSATETSYGGGDSDAGLSADFFPPPDRSERSPDRSVLTVLGAVAAAVVVLGGGAWWFTRPDPTPPPAQLHPVVIPTGDSAAASAPAVAEDGPLPVTIESDCPGQRDPSLAASSDANSAWVCPTGGVPFGQQLVLTLPKPYVITGIKFWPGFQGQGADGGDEWYRHRLINTAQIVFNDPDRTLVSLTPQAERRQYAKALNHILANQATITLLDTAAPPPAPAPSATAVPPGIDPTGPAPLPDLGSLFPTNNNANSDDGPESSSVAMWGLQLIGHLP